MRRRIRSAAALPIFLIAAACAETATDLPTFSRDVAPLVHEHCTVCHRPGEAGPFDLLTYADVKTRGEQIVEVTASGFMPPWLPAPGHARFQGERRLEPAQIELLARWFDGGMIEGDADDLAPAPLYVSGWQLGTPDLELALSEPYTLPADGADVIRNFVIPLPLERPRFVSAVDLRPGNKRIVHHAVLKADRTRGSRRLAGRDPQAGFDGMRMGNAESPGGHVIVWTPGAGPYVMGDGFAVALQPGTDMVLQLHMVPNGKPEPIDARIGIYFTDEPTRHETFAVMLREERIDIPAGATSYAIDDHFELPVPVDLIGIYPHAHYLGKTMRVEAELPDGSRRSLLRIDDWDFNWQGMYRYVEPIRLAAGTTVRMRFTYDNSASNVRNPNIPPRRVVAGNRSSDEMGNLLLQVLPADAADMSRLREAQWIKLLVDDPTDPAAHYNLGVEYARQERYADAVVHYQSVIRVDPEDSGALSALAGSYFKLGEMDAAAEHYERVTRIDSVNAEAHLVLGWIRSRQGAVERAERHYREALRIDPELEPARKALERLRAAGG